MSTTTIDTPRRYAASAPGRRRVLAVGAGVAAGQRAEPPEPTDESLFEQVSIRDPFGSLLVPAGSGGVTASPDNAAMTDLDVWKNLPVVPGDEAPGTAIPLADRMDTVLTELAGS